MSDWAVGVDLGGTNVRVAGVGRDARVGVLLTEPLDRSDDAPGFAQLTRLIADVVATRPDTPPLGIGIGATGPVWPRTGIIDNPFTLPPSYQGDVRTPLGGRFGIPVLLENDANSAALGEAWVGVGRDAEVVVAVTVGTGIGAGVVVRGRLHRGADDTHPEAGHHVVDPSGPACYCGGRGCVESLASASAVLRAALEDGVVPPGAATRDVFEAAAAGDNRAVVIVGRAREALAAGVRNLVAVHAPDVVVLAGNALGDPAAVLPSVQTAVDTFTLRPMAGVRVVAAELGGAAGAIGAAHLVLSPGNGGT